MYQKLCPFIRRRRKIDLGAVVISDENYLKKNTEPLKRTRKRFPGLTVGTDDIETMDELESTDEEEDEEEQHLSSLDQLASFWKSISTPTTEEELKGCWCACMYLSKKRELLYFGRVMRRFLVEAGGPVESLQIDCFVMEQSGSPRIFENIGSHLGQDIDIFNVSNVLCRVQMVPNKGGK